MKRYQDEPNNSPLSKVEQLLEEASQFNPPSDRDFVARAMDRLEEPRRPLFTRWELGAAAAALALGMFWSGQLQPPQPAGSDVEDPPAVPVMPPHLQPQTAHQSFQLNGALAQQPTALADEPERRGEQRPEPQPHRPVRPNLMPRRTGEGGLRLASQMAPTARAPRMAAPARPTATKPPEPMPVATWTNTTVERVESTVVTEGYMVRRDEETGELVLVPTVVSIPIEPDTTRKNTNAPIEDGGSK